MVVIDFQKAHERLSPTYIREVFEKANFGPRFMNLLSATVSENLGQVLVNENIGELFKMSKGDRQGNPVAPIINLCLESLSNLLCHRLKGIELSTLTNIRFQNLAFADD